MGQLSLPKAFILVAAATFLLYPGIFLFLESPFVAKSWTLQDPTAGLHAFVPGRAVGRYELFENWNILWSSLRNTGAPILGNEVQSAPLFPLTLALAWLPDPYFWNAFVAVRLVLMWFGAFLIGTTILKLDRMPAFVFAACFVGTVGVARWLNHPWQNGLAAGIWFLYFIGRAFMLASMPWGRSRFFNTLGLAVGTYALLTCGFPEATLVIALLGTLVFTPILLAFLAQKPSAQNVTRLLLDLAFGGLTGALLASPQVFALVENVWHATPSFRPEIGLVQYPSLDQLLMMVTRYGEAAPPTVTAQTLGLIPLTLALTWIIARLMQRRIDLLDGIALLTISFYVLKAFPLWPAFNRVIGSIPLLNMSWFTVYFHPIGLFGLAIFAARGAAFIFSPTDESNPRRQSIVVGLSLGIVAMVAWAGSMRAQSIDVRYFAPILFVFALFVCCTVLAIRNRSSKSLIVLCSIGVLCALLQELFLSKPAQFVGYRSLGYAPYADASRLGHTLRSVLEEKGIRIADAREASGEGKYVSSGIATIDNGATAILTPRAQLFRTGLFKSDWNGYLELQTEKRKDAYRIAGRNIVLITQPNLPDRSGDCVVLSEVGATTLLFDQQSPGRAFVAARCRPATDAPASLAIMSDEAAFHVGDVVVENMAEAEAALCSSRRAAWQRVSIVQDKGTRVGLEKVQGPAIVTLNDSAYPGWRAFDRTSGAELAIRPGNLNFRTVFLPEASEYQVEFVYRPSWLWTAFTLIAIAGAAWLALAIWTFLPGAAGTRPLHDERGAA
jgi:hypothetical protein